MVFWKIEFHGNKIYDVFLASLCNHGVRDELDVILGASLREATSRYITRGTRAATEKEQHGDSERRLIE